MWKTVDLKDTKTRVCLILLVAFIVLTFFRFFYKLGAEVVQHTDEAWHGVNVYEMYESGNWMVPTQYHEVDYASKPPLNFWADLILFKLIGPSELALRLPSAISGFVTYLILIGYLWKNKGLEAAVFFAAAFPALRECFRFHMFRTGDMDAMFGLFFVLAVLALKRVGEGEGRMLLWAALYTALAFLVKTAHVAVIVLIGICYLPVIYRQLNVKRIVNAVVVFVLPVLVWIVLRYPYDGFSYIRAIVFGEASGKTGSLFTVIYVRDVLREKITWLMIAVLTIRGCVYLWTHGDRNIRKDLIAWGSEHYLNLLVIFVPIIFYSVAGATMSWYIYPAYFGIATLIATQSADILEIIQKKYGGKRNLWRARILQTVLLFFVAGSCVIYTFDQMSEYRYAGNGGFSLQQFRSDLKEYVAQNGDVNRGKRAYIANDRHRNYGDRGHWEQTFLFYGYTICGFDCREGGVEAFLEDEDSLIILDGELWEEYADVLTGHVFLQQNTYYVLNHEYYQ